MVFPADSYRRDLADTECGPHMDKGAGGWEVMEPGHERGSAASPPGFLQGSATGPLCVILGTLFNCDGPQFTHL